MHTPNEIKKGLECYAGKCEGNVCNECQRSVYTLPELFINEPAKDALAYIQQLEADLKSEREQHQYTIDAANVMKDEAMKLESRLAQVERERDAAVKDLKLVRCCGTCVNNEGGCTTECYIVSGVPSGWEWRGVCEENTEEE